SAIGDTFWKSVDAGFSKKDGNLVLYFEMQNISGKSKVPDIPVAITDDQNRKYIVDGTTNSFGHGIMEPEKTYIEFIEVPAYLDAEYFVLTIGETKFKIPAVLTD